MACNILFPSPAWLVTHVTLGNAPALGQVRGFGFRFHGRLGPGYRMCFSDYEAEDRFLTNRPCMPDTSFFPSTRASR